nr:MAG TPA: hypothetical protein [Caudoviricetes sp.]DAY57939.1 MAG TPA: hypothetical protein [Caudoviricetes sp.]
MENPVFIKFCCVDGCSKQAIICSFGIFRFGISPACPPNVWK